MSFLTFFKGIVYFLLPHVNTVLRTCLVSLPALALLGWFQSQNLTYIYTILQILYTLIIKIHEFHLNPSLMEVHIKEFKSYLPKCCTPHCCPLVPEDVDNSKPCCLFAEDSEPEDDGDVNMTPVGEEHNPYQKLVDVQVSNQ